MIDDCSQLNGTNFELKQKLSTVFIYTKMGLVYKKKIMKAIWGFLEISKFSKQFRNSFKTGPDF